MDASACSFLSGRLTPMPGLGGHAIDERPVRHVLAGFRRGIGTGALALGAALPDVLVELRLTGVVAPPRSGMAIELEGNPHRGLRGRCGRRHGRVGLSLAAAQSHRERQNQSQN